MNFLSLLFLAKVALATSTDVAPVSLYTPASSTQVSSTTLIYQQEVWIGKLALCESGDNDLAINPMDTDGTASLGTFQFKVSTYEWLLDKYDIIPAPIFSSTTQRAIVRRMINDPQIKIHRQFPTCVKKIGLPPMK